MWFLSDKIKVVDSGLLEGFCDCHCHLVPDVDDGVKTVEDSLRILEKWNRLGVKEVWMTPHIMEDIPNKPEVLKDIFENVKASFLGDVKLHLASENMLDNLFLTRLNEGNLLPIGSNEKHLLVETSYYNPPMDMERFFEKIKEKGYTSILAHPERYQYMDMRDYQMWKSKGVLLQLNVPSLVGAYGPEVQWKAEKLLDKGMYDFCGSDTHSMRFVEYFLNSKIAKKTVKKVHEIAFQQEL
jgi:tyrosine-protein phosphatase YwqE